MRKRIVVMALAAVSAIAQTQIDLRTQAKSVDFSAAGSTKPLKTGTTLPGTCAVGEVFFKTPAPSGANLYACATPNAWTVQGGITSQNCWADAVTNLLKCQDSLGNVYAVVQTAASGTANQWVDYISASGTPHTSRPTAAAVGAVADPGSNGIIYRNGAGTASLATADQLSGPFFCQDSGSSGAYQCNLSPAPGGYATGSTYWFKANTANSGAASINFNGLGGKTIKKLASQDLAAGDIQAGQWVLVTYDGTNMQMQNQTGSAMQTNQSNTITAGTQDFSGAAHTLPMKSGTLAARPASCTVGETYFATDASAGSNVYGCTAVNTWSAQGSGGGTLAVENFGVAVGSRPTINIIPGQGLSSILTDTGSKVNIQLGLDSAVMQTQTVAQSGSFLLCASSGGSTVTYRCSLNPTAALYTAGMTLHWIPDVGGAGGATTLNVDTLGAIPVKMADGTTDPSPSSIVGGQLYSIWYDGAHFRMPQAAGLSDPGSSGLVYRSALNTTTPAAGHSVAALLACVAAAGSGTTYSCATAPAFTPAAGDELVFKADVANTGAATLNVNGAGARTVRKQGGSTGLGANDLLAGQWVGLIFDGTNWQMQGQIGNTAGGDTITSPNGTLNSGGTSTNTTLDVKTTLIAQKFFGTSAPESVAGNLPGDTFNDTTNHNVYTCNAPSGTAAPACTAVATGGWTLGGGAMVYPGAGVAVSSGSGWITSVPISASPGANTIPTTDSSGVLNVPAGFSSTGAFAATGATQAKPAAPASGSLTEWFDATLGIPQWENSAGTIVATSVVPASGATENQWVDYIPNTGTPHTSQPAFANMSDALSSAKVMGTNSGKAPIAATAGDVGAIQYVAGGGTANAQTVTLAPAVTALVAGLSVKWLPIAANSGGATLAVNGLTATAITKCGTTALAANDLTTAAVAAATYDGTRFQLQNPQATGCGTGGTASFAGLSDMTAGIKVLGSDPATKAPVASNANDISLLTYGASGTTGGNGNAQTVTLNPAPVSLLTGITIRWKPTMANTGTTTVLVNGLGTPVPLRKCGTTELAGNDLTTAALAIAHYDGTQFQLQNPQTAACGNTSINGVVVSGTPVAGQVPTATGSSTATWQAPSGGGTGIGRSTLTATWTAISDGTCQEQTITSWTGIGTSDTVILGIPSGFPTGLFANGRVSGTNTVAIRICNLSGAAVTPGSQTFNGTLAVYNLSGSGTINFASIPDGTCAASTFSLTGVAAGDPVAAKWPSTLETGLFGSMVASAADTVQVRLCNLSGAAVDPANQTFGASIAK